MTPVRQKTLNNDVVGLYTESGRRGGATVVCLQSGGLESRATRFGTIIAFTRPHPRPTAWGPQPRATRFGTSLAFTVPQKHYVGPFNVYVVWEIYCIYVYVYVYI